MGSSSLFGVRAGSSSGVARSSLVALVRVGANDIVRSSANSSDTSVGLRASISVITRSSVRLLREFADSSVVVASGNAVALIRSSADDRVGSNASSIDANIKSSASISIIAARLVRSKVVIAFSVVLVALSTDVAHGRSIANRGNSSASSIQATVSPSALVSVIAGSSDFQGGDIASSSRRVAGSVGVALARSSASD